MATDGVGSEILANRLFTSLVGELNATLPDVNLFGPTHSIPWDVNSEVFKPVEKVSIEGLVGYFDALMCAFKGPLQQEYDRNRITGAEYSKTYIALTQSAMASAVQFALGRDQAFWLAAKTQADAITSQNQNELARIQAMLGRANYALTKLKLATEDSQFGTSELQRTEVLPSQILMVQEQTKLATEQTETAHAQTQDNRLSDGLPVAGIIGGQKLLTTEQRLMVHEQMEGQRAQTLDTRADNEERTHSVTNPDGSSEERLQGLLGVQNFLYRQQIYSYREDVKVKAARIFSDLWITQKTIKEDTQASGYFQPPNTVVPNSEKALNGIFKAMRISAMGGTNDGYTP